MKESFYISLPMPRESLLYFMFVLQLISPYPGLVLCYRYLGWGLVQQGPGRQRSSAHQYMWLLHFPCLLQTSCTLILGDMTSRYIVLNFSISFYAQVPVRAAFFQTTCSASMLPCIIAGVLTLASCLWLYMCITTLVFVIPAQEVTTDSTFFDDKLSQEMLDIHLWPIGRNISLYFKLHM